MASPSLQIMRFLHTSDWHLGRAFHHVGLLDAQAGVLDHIVESVRSERLDAVLVAGDIYDRALPAPDAIELLSQTVARIIDAGAKVVLTSGNHDSAVRLGFASSLLENAGLHIRTSLADIARPVLISGVAIYPLPYLDPAVNAPDLGTEERTHAGVLRAAMDRVRGDLATRAIPGVVMAHAFVTGGATCDSERDISVGGVNAVHPDTFAGLTYAALGHLHGQQLVADGVRYSGAPVAMSFSEASHVKGYSIVEVDDRGLRAVEHVAAPVARPLATLRGRLDDLLSDPAYANAEHAWCAAVLTDAQRPLAAMERLRRRFPHMLKLDFAPEGVSSHPQTYAARVAARSPLEVCCDFVSHVRAGAAAGPRERALLREALEGGRLASAAADGVGSAAVGAATAPAREEVA